MNINLSQPTKNLLISSMLGVTLWVFFGIFYRHHLHYQEQLQLFLITGDYFTELISRPGGLAVYLGRFFTQFFYHAVIGSLLLATLMVLLQRLILDAANYIVKKPVYTLLTCLPSLLFAALFCNEDTLLSGLIALILSFSAVALYNRLPLGKLWRTLCFAPVIPALYWLVGTAGIIFPLAVLSTEWVRGMDKKHWLTLAIASLAVFAASPYLAKAILVQYPIERLLFAGDYFRFVNATNLSLLYICVISALIPLAIKFLPEPVKQRTSLIYEGFLLLTIALIAYLGINKSADWSKEEVMAYDYYARTQQWERIIEMADKKTPDGPLTVATLNLALAKTGTLPQKMFSYYQNGVDGLILGFRKNYITAIMGGEIYYHLGMINTAQRFVFEGMETIPDYQKSVRSMKRLAETNIINGQQEIARKYILQLENTLFYSTWAKEMLALLADEAQIDSHPELGTLKTYRLREDFLFSEQEKDMMLGLLYQTNPSNTMAYEYLLAYTLLNKDLHSFLNYYRMGEATMAYPTIPKSYQEALIYIWGLSNNDIEAIDYPISPEVKRKVQIYGNTYRNFPAPEPMLREHFSDTYWYYLHFRTINQSRYENLRNIYATIFPATLSEL